MIIEALMNVLHGLARTVFAGLRAILPSPPGFWSDAARAVNDAFLLIPSPVRHFVPIVPVSAAGVAMVTLIATFGAVRLARRVVSLFTGGGGMA